MWAKMLLKIYIIKTLHRPMGYWVLCACNTCTSLTHAFSFFFLLQRNATRSAITNAFWGTSFASEVAVRYCAMLSVFMFGETGKSPICLQYFWAKPFSLTETALYLIVSYIITTHNISAGCTVDLRAVFQIKEIILKKGQGWKRREMNLIEFNEFNIFHWHRKETFDIFFIIKLVSYSPRFDLIYRFLVLYESLHAFVKKNR